MSKTYLLTKEFLPMIKLSPNSYKVRKEDYHEWWMEQFNFTLSKTKPIYITVDDDFNPKTYKKMPRGKKAWEEKKKQKMVRYGMFLFKDLGNEGKLTSKSEEARLAIMDFAGDEYGHTSFQNVSKVYIGPLMDTYCEKIGGKVWVDYKTYQPLDTDNLKLWKEILKKNKIDEDEMIKAFVKSCNGDDITKEQNYYKKSMKNFQEKTGRIPIPVNWWILTQEKYEQLKKDYCVG